MNKNYGNLKLSKFESKLKFYFSLLFISNEDFNILRKTFKNNIDIFDDDYKYIDDKNIDKLSAIIDNVYYNYNNINIEDNVISRLFTEDELINYHNNYIDEQIKLR